MKKLALFLILIISFQVYGKLVIEDRFEWLENVDSPQTIEWLATQQEKSDAYFYTDDIRERFKKRLTQLMDYDESSIPQKYKDGYIFRARLKNQKQACIYHKDAQGKTKLLVEPADNYSITDYAISEKNSLIAYGLSKAGSDWQEWHIKDIDTGKELLEVLYGIKFSPPVWDPSGEGLHYFSFNKDSSSHVFADTEEEHLYYHKIGTPVANDQKMFSQQKKDSLYLSPMVTADNRFIILHELQDASASTSNGVLYKDLTKDSSDLTELLAAGHAHYFCIGDYEGRLYFLTNDQAPKGKIFSISLSDLDLSHAIIHIEEGENYIQSACIVAGKIVVTYLKDVHNQIKIFNCYGNPLHEVSLPRLGSVTVVPPLNSNDAEFFFAYTDFITPQTVYRCEVETGNRSIFSAPTIRFHPNQFTVEQIFYKSKDGTSVPMFLVYKKNMRRDGNNPTLLYAYGGFGLSVTPSFSPQTIAWLEQGGIYAVANIRGGSEYGEEWHHAGMKEKKQNVFDDFIAAAEWLCDHHYTSPSKLAITGTSNGGLLVGACLVQRPELFAAAIPCVGVFDMLKFHKFTIGWMWTGEYGSPDDPDAFQYLYEYSPYHQVKPGIFYPATLIITGDHDNRVVPIHSYKFAAALQDAQNGYDPILLRVYKDAGHGAGKSKAQWIEENADILHFLSRELRIP